MQKLQKCDSSELYVIVLFQRWFQRQCEQLPTNFNLTNTFQNNWKIDTKTLIIILTVTSYRMKYKLVLEKIIMLNRHCI